MDSSALITSILTLLSKGVQFGGAFMVVWGAVGVGTNLKDHNGPGITAGIWTLVGGLVIVAAGIMFGTLTW